MPWTPPSQWQKGAKAAGKGTPSAWQGGTRPQPIRVAPPQAAPYPVGKQQGQAEPGGKGTVPPATVASPAKPLPLPAGKRSGLPSVVKREPEGETRTPDLRVTTAKPEDGIGIQTIIGDYADVGSNHGRRYYQRLGVIEGHEAVKVFLYYWDDRDGKALSGWWFGDEIGGVQVWAQNPAPSPVPPRDGWKVPWDAPAPVPGLLLVEPFVQQAQSVEAGDGGNDLGKVADEIQASIAEVEKAEHEAKSALASSASVLDSSPARESLQDLVQVLETEKASTQELLQKVSMQTSRARKGGVSSKPVLNSLLPLLPRLRSVQASLSTELQKVRVEMSKPRVATKQEPPKTQPPKAQPPKPQPAGRAPATVPPPKPQPPIAIKAEEKAAAELSDIARAEEEMAELEESLRSIVDMADPLMAEPPDGESEMLQSAIDEVETAAKECEKRVAPARLRFSKLQQAAKNLPLDVRAQPLADTVALHNRLSEAMKKILPLKTFRKDFQERLAAKRSLDAFSKKVSEAELEVEKVAMMHTLAENVQMCEEEITSSESVLRPAILSLVQLLRTVEQRLASAKGPMKVELVNIKDKINELKQKGATLSRSIAQQQAGLASQKVLKEAAETVAQVEELLMMCTEAEMPFLKGLEVLPPEESAAAAAECASAAAKTEVEARKASAFLNTKMNEVKRLSLEPAMSSTVMGELKQLLSRVAACTEKVAEFKKETEDRKVNSQLADIVQSVSEAARSAEEMTELAKIVQKASEDLSSVPLAELQSERFADAEKASMKALNSTTKELSARLLASKGSQQQALKKLQTRLSSISKDIVSAREVLAKRAKLIEGKELLQSEEKRLKGLEEAMASAQAVASLEEVTSGELDDEKVEELNTVLTKARDALKASAGFAARRRSAADGPLKAALQSLGERTAQAQSQLNAMLAASKAQRGRIQSAVKMREVKAKADMVEQLLDKVNETELPFLKGMEILPADEVAETVGAAEKAAEELEGAIVDARQFQASAAVDLKANLSADALKSFMKDVTEQSARVNAAAAQLLQFRKAHVARKKAAQRYEAESKVSELEKAVAELEDEATAFLEGDLPEEELSLRSGEASAKVKSVQDAVSAARQLVFKCQRDGVEDFAAKLKDLQVRISQSNVALGKAGKTIAGIELKFTAQRTRVEAVKALAEMEEQVERAQAACKPLLEDEAAAVLVDQYQQNVASALWKQMLEKGLAPERLFVEAGAKGGRLDADSLVSFLQAQATPTTKERRASLVARYSTEGSLDLAAFKKLLRRRFAVEHAAPLRSKGTTSQASPGDVFEAYTKVEGAEEVEGCLWPAGISGFLPVVHQGSKCLRQLTGLDAFCILAERVVQESAESVRASAAKLEEKVKDFPASAKTSTDEVKAEVAKLLPKRQVPVAALSLLQKQMAMAKKNFAKVEAAERAKSALQAESEAAEEITKEVRKKVEEAEAMLQKLEELIAPFLKLKASGVGGFETPAALEKDARELHQALRDAASNAKTSSTETAREDASHGGRPAAVARRELAVLSNRAEKVIMKGKLALTALEKLLEVATSALSKRLGAALRSEKTPVKDLTQEGFRKHILSVASADFTEDQASFLSRRLASDGLGVAKLSALIQQFYVVEVPVALTSDMNIGIGKTVRKPGKGEFLEALEGPTKVTSCDVERIRARCVTDGSEGWITIKGNQGTPYLQETPKPYYISISEEKVPLQGTDDADARNVEFGEVLELLQGPKTTSSSSLQRARGKALKDNAAGWFTVVDKFGQVCAEKGEKLYRCASAVAMTDDMDLQSKMIKKLDIGTYLLVEGSTQVDPATGISRLQGQILGEETSGWVTVKGNAGTVFLEPCTKHYAVTRSGTLHRALSSSSPAVRPLLAGEVLEVLEPAKEEPQEPDRVVQLRPLQGGSPTWVSVGSALKQWSRQYRAARAFLLRAGQDEASDSLRQVTKGEVLEATGLPSGAAGGQRLRLRAKKDNLVGWASLLSKEGEKLLIPIWPSSSQTPGRI